jgi:hypothetical protein
MEYPCQEILILVLENYCSVPINLIVLLYFLDVILITYYIVVSKII